MKLNNKGFTLVELLAVLAILITILLVAIPSITSSLSRSEHVFISACFFLDYNYYIIYNYKEKRSALWKK